MDARSDGRMARKGPELERQAGVRTVKWRGWIGGRGGANADAHSEVERWSWQGDARECGGWEESAAKALAGQDNGPSTMGDRQCGGVRGPFCEGWGYVKERAAPIWDIHKPVARLPCPPPLRPTMPPSIAHSLNDPDPDDVVDDFLLSHSDARVHRWLASQYHLSPLRPDAAAEHLAHAYAHHAPLRDSKILPDDNLDDPFSLPHSRENLSHDIACDPYAFFAPPVAPLPQELDDPLSDAEHDALDDLVREMNSWRVPASPNPHLVPATRSRAPSTSVQSDRDKVCVFVCTPPTINHLFSRQPLPAVPSLPPGALSTAYTSSVPSSPTSALFSSPPSSPHARTPALPLPPSPPLARRPSLQRPDHDSPAASPRRPTLTLTPAASYASLRSRARSSRFPSISTTLSIPIGSDNSPPHATTPGLSHAASNASIRHAIYIPDPTTVTPVTPTTPTPTISDRTPPLTNASSFASSVDAPNPLALGSQLHLAPYPLEAREGNRLSVYPSGGAGAFEASRWSIATSANGGAAGGGSSAADPPKSPSIRKRILSSLGLGPGVKSTASSTTLGDSLASPRKSESGGRTRKVSESGSWRESEKERESRSPTQRSKKRSSAWSRRRASPPPPLPTTPMSSTMSVPMSPMSMITSMPSPGLSATYSGNYAGSYVSSYAYSGSFGGSPTPSTLLSPLPSIREPITPTLTPTPSPSAMELEFGVLVEAPEGHPNDNRNGEGQDTVTRLSYEKQKAAEKERERAKDALPDVSVTSTPRKRNRLSWVPPRRSNAGSTTGSTAGTGTALSNLHLGAGLGSLTLSSLAGGRNKGARARSNSGSATGSVWSAGRSSIGLGRSKVRGIGGSSGKRLVVNGLGKDDARGEAAVKAWCESFGEGVVVMEIWQLTLLVFFFSAHRCIYRALVALHCRGSTASASTEPLAEADGSRFRVTLLGTFQLSLRPAARRLDLAPDLDQVARSTLCSAASALYRRPASPHITSSTCPIFRLCPRAHVHTMHILARPPPIYSIGDLCTNRLAPLGPALSASAV
ncbi:hypothetical protein HETIRDRAFT_152497 [Heterobasidion irregulare TC 32-1]|uniref:Uncharacterized protein n=1 Tax=Heterobasidion irregulare (strain TC 32-1) TaxID=747525 RepID=W4JR44_HETIT|nr:uncharacterized protein HETIRDRAFT_152497 [Heterobasidion irregulare TC 32-1]ETW76013.1 hypothetical protein HETIRDRAFT_152497 [Heterobasidion irregulare TC 32-1]